MDVLKAIKSRQSIRRYKPDQVKEEDLKAVLEAARRAPSWHNTQCWRFIVVKDKGIKAELAETITSIYPKNPSIDAIKNAPVVIVACALLKKTGFTKTGEPATAKGDWYMFDVALAMQNLVLAATSLGLGTVHVGYFDDLKAAEILGLPEDMACVEMTPLGYPDEKPKIVPRKELSDIVFYDKYS